MNRHGDVEVMLDCKIEMKIGTPEILGSEKKSFRIRKDIIGMYGVSYVEDINGEKTVIINI